MPIVLRPGRKDLVAMTVEVNDPVLARLRDLAALWDEWRGLDLAAPAWEKTGKVADCEPMLITTCERSGRSLRNGSE